MPGCPTVAFTLDVYSHVTETLQREAARTMDALLGGEEGRVGVAVGVERGDQTTSDPVGSPNANTTRRWARQDSNLRPEGYEPPALTG